MKSYVGWSPTITGRLSFSQVGNTLRKGRDICNHAFGEDAFIFGSETRISRDGPGPIALIRLPRVHYLIFLHPEKSDLPLPLPASCGPDHEVEHHADNRGALAGEIIFLTRGKLAKLPHIKEALQRIAKLARDSRGPRTSEAVKLSNREAAAVIAEELWDKLVSDFRKKLPTPAFGRARVNLARTGRCQVDVDAKEIYTTKEMKLAQLSGEIPLGASFVENALASTARQVFFLIRDLAHRHYHHEPHSDLLTTTYPWSVADDLTWRRETQYGLARLAISTRRRDTARAYKEALGLIAYADAFQRHLCGWVEGAPPKAKRTFLYDFGALKASIEASLKVRELKDAQRKGTLLFVFGFAVTALGIVVTGVRAQPTVPKGVENFSNFLSWVNEHPLTTVVMAALTAWFVDLAFNHLALAPPLSSSWSSGLGRTADAIMGSLMWRRVGSALTWLTGVLFLSVVVAVFAIISGLALYWAYSHLG